MTTQQSIDQHQLRRITAAYKLRLANKADAIGARQETWGRAHTISKEVEQKFLTGEDRYRISPYPYPGLRSFDSEEGELFFGRDKNVEALREILAARRLVVVLGGSGSGKSSLVRAGLLPFLNTERRIPGRDGNWYAVQFRPRTDPLGELAAALVDQLIRPLLRLRAPGLRAELGLSEDADGDAQDTVDILHANMRERFKAARSQQDGRKGVLAELLAIADRQLDTCDRLVTQGRRLAEPNIFLLVDQLEEVFRPEVAEDERATLLNLLVDVHEHMKTTSQRGALFLAATMRSEEVHRCAEHRGLSEVVIGSGYQVELLDPEQDAKEFRSAIVQPARNVFEDWGLGEYLDHPDAPFAVGMPDYLMRGAARLSAQLDHRPDQLPLLQHALQAAWHAAMRRWSTPNFRPDRLEIIQDDLPGQVPGAEVPDLGTCLQVRVDKAADRAAQRFAEIAGTDPSVGRDALQAAFRALARRDDKGNWARRFAGRDEITAFLQADTDSAVARVADDVRWHALEEALHVFLLRGYMSGGGTRKYDISHEALIRNWPQFQAWLRGPNEVAYALGRVLLEVEPDKFEKEPASEKMRLIPEELARRVASVGEGGKLPMRWGEDQIAPYLLRPALREVWGYEKEQALRRLTAVAASAEEARAEAAAAAKVVEQREEVEKQRRKMRQYGVGVLAVVIAFAGIAAGVVISQRKAFETEVAKASEALARAETEAKATALKLSTANNMMGLIPSERARYWSDGVRERLAIYSQAMIFEGKGSEPDVPTFRQYAMAQWETTVRNLLGTRYRVTLASGSDRKEQTVSCLTIGDGYPAASRAVALPNSATEVQIVQPSLTEAGIRFQTKESGQEWRAATPDFSMRIPAGTSVPNAARICMDPNASVLTLSYPGDPLPRIYEVLWRSCGEGRDCQDGSWQVGWREIPVQSTPKEFNFRASFACVLSMRNKFVAPDTDGDASVEVDFNAQQGIHCDPGLQGLGDGGEDLRVFRASYFPGIATVVRKGTGPQQSLEFKPCNEDASKNPLEPAKRVCELEASSSAKLVLRNSDPRSPDYWKISVEPAAATFTLNQVQFVGPGTVRAAVDGQGNIWLRDAKGHFWSVTNSRAMLKNILSERAEAIRRLDKGWSIDAEVPETLFVMTKDERDQVRPAP